MKDTFYEFYKLPPKKVNEIWEKGILIVDTNVLLDFYRLGPESRKDLKKSIDFFGERIWLPYQAGLEFHRRRESVIKEFGGSKYKEFEDKLNETIVNFKDSFKTFQRHPCIDYKTIEKAIERVGKSLKKKLDTWKNAYPFDAENDEVLEWITTKFDGKTGEDLTPQELLSLYKEGEVRYRAQVPPGYKDANDAEKKEAGQRYVYGDLIIWKSVISKAKKDRVDIIFLTNDNKEDWYEKYKGQTKGPRFELLYREFHKKAGQDIMIMSEATFLKEMKEQTKVHVKDSSIEDAERAIIEGSSFDWLRPFDLRWPLGRLASPSLRSNTILDVQGSLTDFEPVVLKDLPSLYDYPTLPIDPKIGLIDMDYLERMQANPFLQLGNLVKKKDGNEGDKKG
jgi:hypothetical protein